MSMSASGEQFGERKTKNIDIGLPLRYIDTGPSPECAIDVLIESPPIEDIQLSLLLEYYSIVLRFP